jgi:hypothetical protein
MFAAAIAFVILAACFMGPATTAVIKHFSTEVCFSGFALGYTVGAGTLVARIRLWQAG